MQIIEQSHKILSVGTLESVELAGRTAYKSEDKITPGSAVQFIKDTIIKRGHESVLEHFPLVFKIPNKTSDRTLWNIREIQEWTVGFHHTITSEYIYVSMNARTLRDAKRRVNNRLVTDLVASAWINNAVLFDDICLTPARSCGFEIPTQDELLSLGPLSGPKHIYIMIKFITDRGVTHEIVRHRPMAYTQESTRYCNYSKKGVVFIQPVDEVLTDLDLVYLQCCDTEYNRLIALERTPQQARRVLPNQLKTEIVCTGTAMEWQHFMHLRTGVTAHPQMRGLMKPTLEDLCLIHPKYFGGILNVHIK